MHQMLYYESVCSGICFEVCWLKAVCCVKLFRLHHLRFVMVTWPLPWNLVTELHMVADKTVHILKLRQTEEA